MTDSPSAPATVAEHLLGVLVDALSDDLSYEVSGSRAVKDAIRDALDILGPEYQGYRDHWWLA